MGPTPAPPTLSLSGLIQTSGSRGEGLALLFGVVRDGAAPPHSEAPLAPIAIVNHSDRKLLSLVDYK